MRKIEKDMLRAMRERREWRCKNTEVVVTHEAVNVYLHGNRIARLWINGDTFSQLDMTLAGWPTATTRSRLNAICSEYVSQSGFYQMDFEQWYDGFVWVSDLGKNCNISMALDPYDIVEVRL